MKSILVVSQYFYPEQFRVNDICTELKARGYEVTVLTGIPNYPQGEYYEGYSKTERREEVWNGIRIIRLPIEARKKGSLRLGINYLSFVREGRKWIRRNKVDADIVFTYEVSPMTQALVGVRYAKKHHIPHLLYVTDLWPENVEVITGIHNKLFLGAIQKMTDHIYHHSRRILTSSRSFISAIKKRKVSEEDLEFWPQYAEDFYKPGSVPAENLIPQDGKLNLVFAGNIGYAQGLGILADAAVCLKDEKLPVRFSIAGDGRFLPELKKIIDEKGVQDMFNFIGRRPAEEMPAIFAAADALLITLSRSKVFSITIPAKLQSYLACGKPVLVSADGEVQEIVEQADAGLVSAAEDASGLAANVKTFSRLTDERKKEMSRNALAYYERYFDRSKLMNRLETVMQELCR